MFTPPPSPEPPRIYVTTYDIPKITITSHEHTPQDKHRIGRRTRWAVIVVPMAIVLITLSTRYITHPVAFDLITDAPPSVHAIMEKGGGWTPHRRHPMPNPQNTDSSSLASTPTSTGVSPSTSIPIASQTVPTVPGSPPTLPTPFVQPWDSTLSQNFSTASCSNFFTNMTNTTPFRSCRPFSLLFQTSADFIDAQQNLTLMNELIWGTCNAPPGVVQCAANMGWFADSLKTNCAQEIKEQNAMAVDTLTSLQAFQVMYDVGCVADPNSNTYCFLDAVQNKDPSDLNYYSLPLGINLPNSTTPSCSGCTKSVMGIYSAALQNSTQASGLDALKETYNDAVAQSVEICGSAFAQTAITSGASAVQTSNVLLGLVALLLSWSWLMAVP
ncbi:hypothetical protein BDQ17DRAFT_996855 [Cyathus striatus]|nr:hypothetical protein BDQ17DRAFT_996855 [Cyathus striatus]